MSTESIFDTPCDAVSLYGESWEVYRNISSYDDYDDDDDEVEYCDGCMEESDSIIYLDNMNLCHDCMDELYNNELEKTRSKDLKFHFVSNKNESDDLFLGIELEHDITGGRTKGLYQNALHCVKSLVHEFGSNIWLTEDCSLAEHGLEVVTHPMTYQYAESFDFERLFKIMRDHSYSETEECGMHVHVSRRFFESDIDPTGGTGEALFMLMFNLFYDELGCISGRTPASLSNWASPNSFEPELLDMALKDMEELKNWKNNSRIGKNAVINDAPYKTIEVRLFSGTTSADEVLLRLDFVQSVARLAKYISFPSCCSLDYSSFVKALEPYSFDYKKLEAYLLTSCQEEVLECA